MSEEERQQWLDQWRQGGPADGIGTEAQQTPARSDAPSFTAPESDAWRLAEEGPASEVIAEWLTDERSGVPGDAAAGEQAGQVLQRAQRAADRAVDDAVVPRRYHEFIKRYFGRLRETVDDAAARRGAASVGETSSADDDSGSAS